MYRKLNLTADRIEAVLRERRAAASVVGGRVLPGFVEMLLRPEPGTKVSQVKALQADIALAVGNANVRIAQNGANLAIQIGRDKRQVVSLQALLSQLKPLPRYTAVLGLSEDGAPLLARISSPEVTHILVAGTTGSGKTSLAHSILVSLTEQHRPHELGMVIINPKRNDSGGFISSVEKHLLLPVAHDVQTASFSINKLIDVMEKRSSVVDPLPRIVLYIDELADLCMSGGHEITDLITRIAQRGRESGIHLLVCTQKPSAKAIGTLLKSNLPLRLVGRVTSAEDARIASGQAGSGAEKLMGCGDFVAVSSGKVIRFQAAFPHLS